MGNRPFARISASRRSDTPSSSASLNAVIIDGVAMAYLAIFALAMLPKFLAAT
jgi:hypothetical protein